MNRTLRNFILFTVLSVFALPAEAQREINLKIIGTTDVHGALFPYDFINDKTLDYSLANLYTYVLQERARAGQHVILLDNGDILQGQPVVYYANFIDTARPNVVADVYKYMNYDAVTIGNHDIETGPRVYNKVYREFANPVLGANIIETRSGKPAFAPYTVIRRGKAKVAVLGMITPHVPHWLPENLWPGLEFHDMVQTARKWVEHIRQIEKPDVLVGLFHAGHDATYGGSDPADALNENASLLVAQQVPGFDVVFIGHDHDRVNRKVANVAGDSVLILDAGNGARMFGVADVTLKYNWCGRLKVREVNGQLLSSSAYPADQKMLAHFDRVIAETKTFVNRPIGNLSKEISSRDIFFGPSAFIDLIHRVQFHYTGADISFAAPLSFDTQILAGTLYTRDMFKLYRYENLLYTMQLTGQEVKDYLEYSVGLWFNTMQHAGDEMLLYRKSANAAMPAERGVLQNQFYNFDAAAGINYTVDISKQPGNRVTIHAMQDGKPFDLGRNYKVAINSYRGSGGGGHLIEGAGLSKEELPKQLLHATEVDLRYYFMKWIEEQGRVEPVIYGNWKIVPEEWVKQASVREKQKLFRN